MKNKKYIILNFTHGNGPFLRTIELALSINDLLEKETGERFGIIVPWVYGQRQKTVIQDNFGYHIKKYPNEILLDKKIGGYLESIFYKGESYGNSLQYLLKNSKEVETKIKKYIEKGLTSENFLGDTFAIQKKDIAMEVNRCPIVSFGIKPSYYTSFAYMSEILERSLGVDAIRIEKEVLEKTIPYYSALETKQTLRFIADPGTFAYLGERPERHSPEVYTPPSTNQSLRSKRHWFVRKGIYVTVTGIAGLNKRLFNEVHNIGLTIYTNKPGLIPFSKKAKPSILSHKNIILHFTRVGWGSAWLSQLSRSTETPLIALPYDAKDDPEVYFNNICIENIGLGKVYNGQALEELLEFGKEYKKNIKVINENLIKKYGTLNGVEYTAQKIVNHYLGS